MSSKVDVNSAAVLPYGRQCIEDDDVAAVVECLKGDWLTQGPRVAEFEQALCAATGAKFAVAVSNGTAALHLAALVAGVRDGDLGIVPAITFVATANAVRYAGGKVTFCDVDPDTALMDPNRLRELVRTLDRKGTRPKVILPVDMCGQPAPLPEIRALADEVGAIVIEDAAHSLGASYDHGGKRFRAGCCVHSDLATLSFHPVKHVTTGEGGAVLTNSPQWDSRLRELRSHGIHRDPDRLTRPAEGPWFYEQAELGLNYRLTDLQCALGISQLRKLDRFVSRRREWAESYDQELAKAPLAGRIEPLVRRPDGQSSWHLYVVRLNRDWARNLASQWRRELFLFLRERKIQAQVHYIPLTWQPDIRDSAVLGAVCPGAEAYYEGCLSLPLFPAMSLADLRRVTGALADWVRLRSEGGQPA